MNFRFASMWPRRANREDQAHTRLDDAVRTREHAEASLAAARATSGDEAVGPTAPTSARHGQAQRERRARCRALETLVAAARQAESAARGALAEARRTRERLLQRRERHAEEQRRVALRHDEHAPGDFLNADLIHRARLAAHSAGA